MKIDKLICVSQRIRTVSKGEINSLETIFQDKKIMTQGSLLRRYLCWQLLLQYPVVRAFNLHPINDQLGAHAHHNSAHLSQKFVVRSSRGWRWKATLWCSQITFIDWHPGNQAIEENRVRARFHWKFLTLIRPLNDFCISAITKPFYISGANEMLESFQGFLIRVHGPRCHAPWLAYPDYKRLLFWLPDNVWEKYSI